MSMALARGAGCGRLLQKLSGLFVQSSSQASAAGGAGLVGPACLTALRHLSDSAAAAQPSAAAAALSQAGDLREAGGAAAAAAAAQGSHHDRTVPVFNLDREEVGSMTLPGDIFDCPIRRDILHRVVRWQLARRQQGTHVTKTRAMVRGGGRKPRPQKGSGRSRQGTIRAPQWRGGGVAHGPVLRSHEHKLVKRMRRLGLKSALSAKAAEGRLLVLDSLKPAEAKTRVMDAHLDSLLADAPRRSLLFVDSDKQGEDGGEELRRGTANLPWVDVLPSVGLNVYSILQRDSLVMSRSAVEAVVARLRRPLKPWSPKP